MISYKPFFETLKNKNETWYSLHTRHNVSYSTLHRLKHGQDVSTRTLNDLCRILNCSISDIVEYIPNDNDQKL